MKEIKLHSTFKLNGCSFLSEEELLNYTKTLSNSVYTFLKDWFSSQAFVVVQTSGSTGKPKLIQLQKEFMKNSAKATGGFFNLQETTTALLCLSTDYIAGKMMLVRALTLGWHLDVVDISSNPLVGLVKNYDFSAMVPLQVQNSLSSVHKIKKVIVGGGVVSVDLHQKLQALKTDFFATYGMTETITHIAVKKLNHFIGSGSSFYKTLPGVTIYKDDRNCLLIKAPMVTTDFIITNDVVELVSDSEFNWLGRYDNVINSGGVKLHPEKIEEKLSLIIKPRFFITGVKDAVLGYKMVLVVEGPECIIDFTLLQNVSKYEIPKNIYFINQFIETETKKIQRSKTLDLLSFN